MSSIYDKSLVSDNSHKNSSNQMIEQIWNDAFREISGKLAAKPWKPNPSAVKFKKRLAAAKKNGQLPANVTRLGKFFEHDVRGNKGGPYGVRKFKRKKPKRSGELVATVDKNKIKSVVSKSDGYRQCQLFSNLPKKMEILKFLKSQLAAATFADQERHQSKCCCHCACSKIKSNQNNYNKPPHNGIDESVGNFLTDCSSLNFGGATSKRLSATFSDPALNRTSTPAFAQNLLNFAAGHQNLQKVSKQNHHQHCQQQFVEPNRRICMKETRSVVSVRETHQIAQAQQEKNAKLREAFGISEYFVEGTSFDPDRKAKEDITKSEAIQKELAEKETEKANRKRYALVRTPSREKDDTDDEDGGGGHKSKEEKKKKKKKNRDGSSSPERKKDKKKKKKNKKERSKKKKSRKHRDDTSDSDSSDSDNSDSDSDNVKSKKSKKAKKDKKSEKEKKKGGKRDRSVSKSKSPVASSSSKRLNQKSIGGRQVRSRSREREQTGPRNYYDRRADRSENQRRNYSPRRERRSRSRQKKPSLEKRRPSPDDKRSSRRSRSRSSERRNRKRKAKSSTPDPVVESPKRSRKTSRRQSRSVSRPKRDTSKVVRAKPIEKERKRDRSVSKSRRSRSRSNRDKKSYHNKVSSTPPRQEKKTNMRNRPASASLSSSSESSRSPTPLRKETTNRKKSRSPTPDRRANRRNRSHERSRTPQRRRKQETPPKQRDEVTKSSRKSPSPPHNNRRYRSPERRDARKTEEKVARKRTETPEPQRTPPKNASDRQEELRPRDTPKNRRSATPTKKNGPSKTVNIEERKIKSPPLRPEVKLVAREPEKQKPMKSGTPSPKRPERRQSRDPKPTTSRSAVRNKSRSPHNGRRRRSHSKSLSYSPARRHPERYQDILVKRDNGDSRRHRTPSRSRSRDRFSHRRLSPKERRKQPPPPPKPVVKLHPTNDRSDDDEDVDSSDVPAKNSKNEIKIDEFLPMEPIRDQNDEMEMLKVLSAKAKESLEKKKNTVIENKLPIPQTIKVFTSNLEVEPPEPSSPSMVEGPSMGAVTPRNHTDKAKIIIKPFKINDHSPKRSGNNIDTLANEEVKRPHQSRSLSKKPGDENPAKGAKSLANAHSSSIERSSRSRSDSRSTSGSSTGSSRSSRSRSSASSRSTSRSGSQSSSASHSTRSGGSRRRTSRSPSIPRRAGSPSFLDRRRITSARKRPIPYHRSTPSSPSSVSSSYRGSRSPHRLHSLTPQ